MLLSKSMNRLFQTLFKVPFSSHGFIYELEERLYQSEQAENQLGVWCPNTNFKPTDDDRERLLVLGLCSRFILETPANSKKKFKRPLNLPLVHKILSEKLENNFLGRNDSVDLPALLSNRDLDFIFKELLSEKYRLSKFMRSTYDFSKILISNNLTNKKSK